MVLQSGEGENLIGKVEQLRSLILRYAHVLLLQFLLAIELTTPQAAQAHDDAAERCLHVVYHGIGEVLAQAGYHILLTDETHLLQDAPDNQCQQDE